MGTTSYAGATATTNLNINAGTANITGTVTAPNIAVANGATLSGTGSFNGSATVNGATAGSLSVTGTGNTITYNGGSSASGSLNDTTNNNAVVLNGSGTHLGNITNFGNVAKVGAGDYNLGGTSTTSGLDVLEGTLANGGSISGVGAAASLVTVADGTAFGNVSGATVSASGNATTVNVANGGSFFNAGTASNSAANGRVLAIADGAAATNIGTISATGTAGRGVTVATGGGFTNISPGTVSASGADGVALTSAGVNALNNQGILRANGSNGRAVSLNDGDVFDNQADGIIQATGTGGTGIAATINAGQTVTISNQFNGNISGTTAAISGTGAGNMLVDNGGTITGNISTGTGTNTINLRTGSTTTGAIIGNGTNDSVTLSGSGTGTLDATTTFTGIENLTKTLTSGTWNINAAKTVGTGAFVAGGTLAVNSTLTVPAYTNDVAGTTAGTGTIVGDISNLGTFAPGTTTTAGILKVTGDYTQGPTGTLAANIAPVPSAVPGVSYDQLAVDGNVSLAGTLALNSSGNNYVHNQSYDVITADAISGDFDTITGDVIDARRRLTVTTGDTTVTVKASRIASYNLDATTPNQNRVAGGLDAIQADIAPTAAFNSLLTTLDNSAPTVTTTFLQESQAEAAAAAPNVAQAGLAAFGSALRQRAGAVDGDSLSPIVAQADITTRRQVADAQYGETYYDPYAAENTYADPDYNPPSLKGEKRHAWWAQGYGTAATVDTDAPNQVTGYDYAEAGVIGGVDVKIGDSSAVGVAASVGRSDVDFDTRGDNLDADIYRVGAYGKYGRGPASLTVNTSFGMHQYDVTRPVTVPAAAIAQGSFDAKEYAVGAEGAYKWQSGKVVMVPAVSLDYSHLKTDSYTETGAGVANLSVASEGTSSLQAGVGMTVSRPYVTDSLRKVVPFIRAKFAYEANTDERPLRASFALAPGSDYTILGAETGRTAALLGAGVTADLTENVSAFADYQATLQQNATGHKLAGGMQVKW